MDKSAVSGKLQVIEGLQAIDDGNIGGKPDVITLANQFAKGFDNIPVVLLVKTDAEDLQVFSRRQI